MSSHERHRRTLGPEFEMTPEKRDRSSLSLAVPSPSIRRSARLQDSPSVNYNVSIMSKRNGTAKRHTNKRIFGLDASDMNNTSTNLSLNNISAEETQLDSSKGKEKADLDMSLFDKLKSRTQHKLSGYSQSTKMLIASLTFVMMLFIAEQGVYYFYLSVCWSASSLSHVRTMFLSVPEIISSDQDVPLPSSDGLVSIVQDLKLKFEEDLGKLNAEVSRLHLRHKDIENEKLQLLERITSFNHQLERTEIRNEDDSVVAKFDYQELRNEQFKFAFNDIIKDHVEEMSRNQYSSLLEKHEALSNQIKLLTRTKDSSLSSLDSDELMREIEQIKETIRSIKTNSNSSQSEENYISLALAKFPLLSSIGEKFENFESRASRLEEKLDSDINLIIEKHSHNLSQHLEAQMMTQVETLMNRRNGEEREEKLLDWANSELGTKVVAFNGTKTHPEAVSSSLKVFGFSVWKQDMKPSMIIERPHEGRCWPFSGTSGSLLFKFPRKVHLKMMTLTRSPSLANPKDFVVWDHDRGVSLTSFSWNIGDSDKQSFELDEVVQRLRFDIVNNWGEVNMTCVGKIELLGTLEN